MKHARSTIAPENLQEVLDAESSPEYALLKGQQQYTTPSWLADQCAARLPNRSPDTVLDPQCGDGALINLGSWSTNKFGIDIDKRVTIPGVNLIICNSVKVGEVIDDLYPNLHWECVNANPPFGKKWRLPNESVVDSTQWTWKFATSRGNFGYFIANHSTLEKLGISKHPWVYHYETHKGSSIWKGVHDSLVIGIAFWKRPEFKRATYESEMCAAWSRIQEVLDQEKTARPAFNIYLDTAGFLRTYLSFRSETKLKLSRDQITRLHSINNTHPLTLTTEKETRDLMRQLISCGLYRIEPAAQRAIEDAIAQVNALACPLMPVTNFESVAYADEEEALECIKTVGGDMQFTAGKSYSIRTGTYKFVQTFKRKRVHFSEEDKLTYTREHECTLSGQDRYISTIDDTGAVRQFMDRPDPKQGQFDESLLWTIFKRPTVRTIAQTCSELVKQNAAVLRSCEMMAGYEYYPGQRDYLARVAAKDCALVAGETGTGKTLMAISLLAMKGPARALIVAPQGTMRSSDEGDEKDEDSQEYNASQWVQEINRFAPYLQIWEIFSYADYERICSANKGSLPPGVYVSYYQAMFSNGARECAPDSWDDEKLNAYGQEKLDLPPLPPPTTSTPGLSPSKRHYTDTIGTEHHGIRCIAEPCLATLIGRQFDMVLLDEAHLATNLQANITQMIIRLQPKYRYALTATPIPDKVTNLFSLMGWLAVPDWYKGGRRNAAWPYARGELGRFMSTFLSEERDLTEEGDRHKADKRWRGKCVKTSPVISSPARLLKLLKPTMAFVSKSECNPTYNPPKVIDVRVPMGKQQSALYGYYLNRGNVPGRHALVRARRQTAWLRNITADPAGFRFGHGVAPLVQSNMNPKVVTILELTRDILAEGEQVVIINSRVGLTETIQSKLVEAGVSVARIDSTISAESHAYQANLFKRKKARVMLMGIKCAASYSFSECKYAIIGSLEYSPGPFTQAKGRIDRVVPLPGGGQRVIYCILHKSSIEETMFDVVATKDDAATICLRGQRVPRDFKPVDAGEVLATAIERFDLSGATPELECEAAWPRLRESIRQALAY